MKVLAIITLLLSAVLIAGCGQQTAQADPPPESVKDGVFVHLTRGPENPHRVTMALQMATIMSDSVDVLVYLDITGVEVVLKDAADLTYKQFPSSQTQIKKLLDKGVRVMACPGCLAAAGKTAEDLMPGVEVAAREAFFSFTKGRILTIDY